MCGAVIQWLRDGLKLFRHARETEEIAKSVPDTAGVYLVPAFVGLGAPYWDAYARGSIIGLTRVAKREHIVRAALEAMAYQTADVLNAMQKDVPFPIRSVRVDGGASANNFLLAFQSDVLGIDILRPSCVETTALGAAYLAGLGVGYYSDLRQIRSDRKPEQKFSPIMSEEKREELLRGWHRAVERSLRWAESN